MERCSSMNYTQRNMQGNRASCSCQSAGYCDGSCASADEFPIGMAYVPWQKWQNIYEPCRAFATGTIFAELDKPFLGMRGVKK